MNMELVCTCMCIITMNCHIVAYLKVKHANHDEIKINVCMHIAICYESSCLCIRHVDWVELEVI